MPINYAALKTELTTDPNGYGYAPFVAGGNDVDLANKLNEVRTTIQVRRLDITGADLLRAIDTRDLLSPAQNASPYIANWFQATLSQNAVIPLINEDGTESEVLDNIRRMLKDTTDSTQRGSRTRLQNVSRRNGSRAEQLFGTGTVVGHLDVARALRG